MSNPWLSIPLEDYEGHMGSAHVHQLTALAERALDLYLLAPVGLVHAALIDVNELQRLLGPKGFQQVEQECRPLPAGKALWLGVFAQSG